mgnify:CR=1 FL=1
MLAHSFIIIQSCSFLIHDIFCWLFSHGLGPFDDIFHVMSLSGGSLFLFDRKVLRYFRKDGHNWRKKKDGKTVKEAHERLKVYWQLFFA